MKMWTLQRMGDDEGSTNVVSGRGGEDAFLTWSRITRKDHALGRKLMLGANPRPTFPGLKQA